MITNHSKKNYQNELKEWAMNCLLETLLQMREEETLTFPDGADKDLGEVGGLKCLIDEAVAWAEFRLGRDYKENGIIIGCKDWKVEGDVVYVAFTYKAGMPIGKKGILEDKDFIQYAGLAIQALSPNSLRHWERCSLKDRLQYRYKVNPDDYIEQIYPNV